MKLLFSDNNIIVFLFKQNIDFKNTKEVNCFLGTIIKKLSRKINIKGYYDIKIHVDSNYGIIIVLEKIELEYFVYDYVDFNFKVYYEKFIYEVENISFLSKKYKFYNIDNKFYIIPKNLSKLEVGQILEYCKVIYGKDALKIKRKLKIRR